MFFKVSLLGLLLFSNISIVWAENNSYEINSSPILIYVQSHAGQLDTDGILSPGEIRNPRIDYDRAQRQGEWRGDTRFDNYYNDQAAQRERELKYNEDRRENWRHDHKYHAYPNYDRERRYPSRGDDWWDW